MLPWFATLNFLHLLEQKYWLKYAQIGKILGVHKMTVYRYMKKDQLTTEQDFKIKKKLALWITDLQLDFIKTYKIQ